MCLVTVGIVGVPAYYFFDFTGLFIGSTMVFLFFAYLAWDAFCNTVPFFGIDERTRFAKDLIRSCTSEHARRIEDHLESTASKYPKGLGQFYEKLAGSIRIALDDNE